MNRTTGLSALLVACVALAACGSDSKSAPTSTTTVGSTVPTSAATTTTAAAGGGTTTTTSAAGATTSEPSTTAAAVAVPVMPLTGMPVGDQFLYAARPALVVKIDNHPQARPQSGLNAADIVFEENVEQLTRFAAVFQSQDSEPVGPIRSGRTQDVLLLGSLNKPLFAWSGGNANVTRAIDSSDLVDIGPTRGGAKAGYYRDNSIKRDREHTLYSKTTTLYSVAPEGAAPPPQQFQYLAAGQAAEGAASDGVELAMDGVKVRWEWDGGSGAYLRSQDGKPHNDAALGQVNAANVVVLTVDYQPSPADGRSPEAQTIGTGEVTVFTGGKSVSGTWTRADRLAPFTLTAAGGAPILLTPGRTWVELARVGKSTPLAG